MITLWGRNNSTNVKKVIWTLEELDLPFKQIMAGLEHGVNKEAEYLAMNPNGLVPLLRDDETDLTLWESNAIVRYLAAQYGQNRLWIDAPAKRAVGEKWMDWANQTLSPAPPGDFDGAGQNPGSQARLCGHRRCQSDLRIAVRHDGRGAGGTAVVLGRRVWRG
ncbi:Glutathione S-transferase GstB [Leclercia adecarboxylata]|uniref:Glutathione S-transferase GstB n=1 Tax=Leclercia adecarboxylata TaxID=83655 RepID=A0A4U9HN61_9ENTR|nr:Glutathione S-transferase GstB [Leclercia adecarboxylata]